MPRVRQIIPAPFPISVVAETERRYLALLTGEQSPLLENPSIREQLIAQLHSVLGALGPELQWLPPDVEDPTLSSHIGRARAAASVSPAQSLRAAALLFEACLPMVSGRFAELGRCEPELRGATALNSAILNRMSLAGMAYVEQLLASAQSGNSVERRRISRELHDVIGPTIAVALHGLQLLDVYIDTDADAARDKRNQAEQSMRQVMRSIRGLTTELREDVADIGLAAALHRFAESVSGPSSSIVINIDADVDGRTPAVSAVYAEETYLMVREAIRNSLAHARPRRVQAEIRVVGSADQRVLQAIVADDGCGFAPDQRRHGHHGLDSLSERAAILAGHVTIDSAPGVGTTVCIRLPLPPAYGGYV